MKNEAALNAVLAILAGVAIAASVYKVSAVTGLIMAELQIDNRQCGWLVSIVTLWGLILALPAGGIMMKVGAKKLGLFSLACSLFSNVFGFKASTFMMLLLSRLLEGFSFGLISVVAPAIINMWFSEQKRGAPMAIWSCWIGLGLYFSLKSANILVDINDIGSWRNLWIACAVVILMVMILFAVFIKEKNQEEFQSQERKKQFWKGIKSLKAWRLSMIFTSFSFCLTSFMTFGAIYCVQKLGFTVQEANSCVSILSLGMFLGGLVMGIILNKSKKREFWLMISMLLLVVCSSIIFMFPKTIAVVYMILAGFIMQMAPATIFAVAPNAAPSKETVGVTMAIVTIGSCVGGFGAVIIGAVIDNGGYHVATLAIFFVALIGLFGAMTKIKQKE